MASHLALGSGAVSLLAAALLISSCGPSSHAFNGNVDGQPFLMVASVARKLSGGAVGFDLANFQRKCSDPTAPNGSLIVSFVVDAVPLVGVHAVGETVIGSSTTASVTEFSVAVDGGQLPPQSVVLTEGSVTIHSISDAGVGGEARVGGSGATLSGSFQAAWCSP